MLPWGLLRAAALVRRLRPAAVLGVGGYAGGPVTLVAALLGVRTVILEPNATPGLHQPGPAARSCAPAACAYEEARASFGAKGVLTGNPVRGGFAGLPPQGAPASRSRCSPSAAARARASSTRRWSRRCPTCPGAERLRIVHQTGPAMRDEVEAAYAPPGARPRCWPSSTTWSGASARRTSSLSRSGATTCAELTVAGKAAILVPFAAAADDHQRVNARALRGAGAARVLEEKDLSGESLAAAVRGLVDAPGTDRGDGGGGAAARPPDAAARVADLLLPAAEAPRV